MGTSFQNVCSEDDGEGLKARGGKRKREKLFRNQLGIVCSYQNTLLTQTCHGANICSQLAPSVRGMLSVYGTLRGRSTASWLGILDVNERSF